MQVIPASADLGYVFTVQPDSDAMAQSAAAAVIQVNASCAHSATINMAVPTGVNWQIYIDTIYTGVDEDGDGWVTGSFVDATGDEAGLFNHSLIAIATSVSVDEGTTNETTNGTTNGATTNDANTTGGATQIVGDPWGTSSTADGWFTDYFGILILITLICGAGAFTGAGMLTKYRNEWTYLLAGISTLVVWLVVVGGKWWFDADLTFTFGVTGIYVLLVRGLSIFLYAFLLFLILYFIYGIGIRKGRKT